MPEIFQPLELIVAGQGTGRFHFTYTNSTGTTKHECCQQCKHAKDGHASAKEAELCFRQYEARHFNPGDSAAVNEFGRCLETGVLTSGFVLVGRHFLRKLRLCPEAQIQDTVLCHYLKTFES